MYQAHKQRLSLLSPYQKDTFVALLIMVITAAAQLTLPEIANYYIDGHAPTTLLDPFHLWIMAFIMIFALLSALRFYLFESLGIKVITRFRTSLHKALLNKPSSYFDEINAAELTSRINADTHMLKDVLTTSAALFLRSALIVCGCIIMMLSISYLLSAVLLLLIPIFVYATKLLTNKIESLAEYEQDALAKTNKVAFDNLNCHTLIKLYNWFDSSQHRYEGANKTYMSYAYKTIYSISTFQGFFNLLIYSCLISMLILGSHQIAKGQLSIGELTSFVLYLGMAFTSLNTLSGFWAEWCQSIGATKYLFELESMQPRNASAQPRIISIEDIQFKDVSFAYPNKAQQTVLFELNCKIKKGQKNVIAGPSGSGKSTIAKLLLGYYSPTSGKILVGDNVLDEQGFINLRQQTAYVEQEPLFMSLSILDNLLPEAMGTPSEQQMQKVVQACKQANAHDFIMTLPDGYNTHMGDRGNLLSGGQKQRLAIARALLKEPEMVILDEFTSALDAANRQGIEDALNNLLKNKTVLVISHQQSHIEHADNLITL
ncbi:ABC transporter ATP-binding protein [Pseudoalteromonas sp. JBTF-M23]|uniref:ABC transporter ATP-binding protein n=1 Tax=Pseudoalteromonas caenipelagi TaxID=2726988 RepID=A0A849VFI4_9GAMM|nr:ABC transporter ATP-binding protein [Pseudoalteromonas caenipelagi]NOU52489.1 ABC transporter ATP-binding protein [Pseudoalteromonas caenipelagi]